MRVVYTFIILTFISAGLKAQSQTLPAIERRLTLNIRNSTIEAILTEISNQANITFSYNPNAINAHKKTSLTLEDQTVRYALSNLFEGSVSYRLRGKFIILQPIKPPKNNSPSIIEGYLSSTQGNLLPNATIYNAKYKTAVTTNEFGYFHLEIENKNKIDTLKVSKQGYENALLMPVPGKTTFVELTIPKENQNQIKLESLAPTYSTLLINKELKINTSNITETFSRIIQLSLLPHMGTNNLLAGSTSNLISLNLLGGYVESVKAFEAGGAINFVRHNVNGFESAGIANFVGGNFKGMQAAGVLNQTKGLFQGVQMSGIANIAEDQIRGCEISGVYNLAKQNLKGVQISEILNVVKSKCTGVQLAGVMNIAQEMNGLQISMVINKTPKVKGAQIAAIFNSADSIHGIQISTLINKAKYIKGVQLGIVNIADSCQGVAIGLVNVFKNGYNHLDIYATETFYTNVAYCSGTKKFHTIITASIDPRTVGNSIIYSSGFGVGTAWGKSLKREYDLNLTSQQVTMGTLSDQINVLFRLGFDTNWKLTQKKRLILGLAYNLYAVDSSTPQYNTTFSKLPPYFISNEPIGKNQNIKTWYGFKAGIRLL